MRIRSEKGAALLTVLIALMVITILLFEFQYAAMVERKLAYNDLNQTQAYYLAKAGANMGLLRVALYARLKSNPQLSSLGASPQMIAPYLNQIWQMSLPSFPPNRESLSKLDKTDRDAEEKILSETKITEGQYTVTIKSESSKINLNALSVPPNFANQRPNFTVTPTRPDMAVGLMLVNLMNTFLQDSDDPYKEFPNLRPEEQVTDIMDWVTPGSMRLMGGDKDAYYQAQTPPYRAKKNRFFTVEELRLVKGIDGHLFEKLKPYITVYAYDSKVNLNSASDQMLRAIYPEFTEDDIKRIQERRTELGGQWPSEQYFVDFVTENLNRAAFKVFYSDPNNYPFTVSTESFFIESLGIIPKSASSVQRTIKVAVAFTTARGGMVIPNMTQAACNQNANVQFWNPTTNQCITNPHTAQECVNIAGTPTQNGNQLSCVITMMTPLPPKTIAMTPAQSGTSSTPGTTGASGTPGSQGSSGTGTKPPGTNTMKVLYWSES